MNEQQIAAVTQARNALREACGGRCNSEYNPCWYYEVADRLTAILTEDALDKKAENARELGLSYDDWGPGPHEVHSLKQQPADEPVAWDVFSKHGRIYFAIGNQSFPVDYTPEDEPDCSAGQSAEWYMGQLRHALKRLSDTRPQPAAWVGLTDEEMHACWEDTMATPEYSREGIYRAIEAKLRELNGSNHG